MKLMSTCLFMRLLNYKKNLDQKVKRAKHHKHTQHGSDRYILDIRPFHKAYFGCSIF